MTTSCLNPASQTSQRPERSARPVIFSARPVGGTVRASVGAASTVTQLWTVLLRSLATAHA